MFVGVTSPVRLTNDLRGFLSSLIFRSRFFISGDRSLRWITVPPWDTSSSLLPGSVGSSRAYLSPNRAARLALTPSVLLLGCDAAAWTLNRLASSGDSFV